MIKPIGFEIVGQLPQRMIEKVVIGAGVAQSRHGGTKGGLAKKMTLVSGYVPEFVQGSHKRSAGYLSVLIHNDVESHKRSPSHSPYSIVADESLAGAAL